LSVASLAIVAAGVAASAASSNPTSGRLTVASSGDHAIAAAKTVSLKDDFFSPRSVTIRRGGSVRWVWRGQNDHNVVFRKAPSGASKKSARRVRTRGSFTRSFGKSGTYRYVCTVHVDFGMRGVVKVR
jgi:plastocyanin